MLGGRVTEEKRQLSLKNLSAVDGLQSSSWLCNPFLQVAKEELYSEAASFVVAMINSAIQISLIRKSSSKQMPSFATCSAVNDSLKKAKG